MIIHPSFNIKTSQNNIAILTLETNVDLGQYPTIGTVCLPGERKFPSKHNSETLNYYFTI